jgi:mRNA-degrading endonuclease toxin of MazEF toxin-antitoxin module
VIDAGDIYLADLGLEQRHPVVILSPASASRIAGRVVVAPAVLGSVDEVPSPWRIDGFAIDMMTTTLPERLLTQTGRAEARSLRRMLVAARQLL